MNDSNNTARTESAPLEGPSDTGVGMINPNPEII